MAALRRQGRRGIAEGGREISEGTGGMNWISGTSQGYDRMRMRPS